MQKCGLINTTKSNRYKTVTVNPSIESKNSNGSYTWSDFISEHRLNIELSYIFEQNNSKKRCILFVVAVLRRAEAVSPFWIRFGLP
jgi:hypothetical protein